MLVFLVVVVVLLPLHTNYHLLMQFVFTVMQVISPHFSGMVLKHKRTQDIIDALQ